MLQLLLLPLVSRRGAPELMILFLHWPLRSGGRIAGGNAGWVFLEAMRLRGMGSMASEPRYYIGVDLGQSRDPTAIAVVRRVDPPRPVPEHDKPKPNYAPGSLEWEEEQRRLKVPAVG